MAKKRRQMAEMNVVPYIDVMLVLLVIFMVTAPLLKQGVDVALPVASSEPISVEEQAPIIINIDHKGRFFINIGEQSDQAQPLGDIQQQVAAALNKTPKTPVLIGGDHRIDYGSVIKLMNALKASGVPNVGLLTEPPA